MGIAPAGAPDLLITGEPRIQREAELPSRGFSAQTEACRRAKAGVFLRRRIGKSPQIPPIDSGLHLREFLGGWRDLPKLQVVILVRLGPGPKAAQAASQGGEIAANHEISFPIDAVLSGIPNGIPPHRHGPNRDPVNHPTCADAIRQDPDPFVVGHQEFAGAPKEGIDWASNPKPFPAILAKAEEASSGAEVKVPSPEDSSGYPLGKGYAPPFRRFS